MRKGLDRASYSAKIIMVDEALLHLHLRPLIADSVNEYEKYFSNNQTQRKRLTPQVLFWNVYEAAPEAVFDYSAGKVH